MAPDEPASRSLTPESGPRALTRRRVGSGRRRKMARGRHVDRFLAPVRWEKLQISSLRSWWCGWCRKISPEKKSLEKSPENIAEKILTVMRVFWPRYGWPESFGRWKRWPEWNTVIGWIPGINYTGKLERIKFSPLALIPCWKRERENLNSHSYD